MPSPFPGMDPQEPLPRGDYFAFVSRAERKPKCEVYAWGIRHALPTIPIPLKSPEADIPLDLAAIFTQSYDQGRYLRSLAYQDPMQLPLAPEDTAWANSIASSTAQAR